MEWSEFAPDFLRRPGMWVPRPYIDHVFSLWQGFSVGSNDSGWNQFATWLRTEKFPEDSGFPSNLAPWNLIRRAVTGQTTGPLSEEEDRQAVALLTQLIDEFNSR